MNEETSPIDYKQDYKLLELHDREDWQRARANYRRLVHIWHPDKYARRPRERQHAQQQFIALTKSYDNLRTFYRDNGRLPFEPHKQKEPEALLQTEAKKLRKGADDTNWQKSSAQATGLESGILGRDSSQHVPLTAENRGHTKFLWLAAGCLVLGATVFTFFLLDQRANQRIAETGREVVRQAPRSEFMPSAAEIRRSEARGAFVQPTR